MTQAIQSPQVYRPGLWTRLAEGFRYGGGVGQWSWLVHRVTGLGILLYLVAHVCDTFFVVINPAWYDHTLALYGGWVSGNYYWPVRWAFRVGELGLIGCVLFHAINGIRIILFDFWPAAARMQRPIFRGVLLIFLPLYIIIAIWVLMPLASSPPMPPESPSASSTMGQPTE